ncbi:MAG: tail fiber domain-containing protein [Parcubacteria group bacterium]|nr:tail fiber domain-containing protein [Parcubacteria group bacterium]
MDTLQNPVIGENAAVTIPITTGVELLSEIPEPLRTESAIELTPPSIETDSWDNLLLGSLKEEENKKDVVTTASPLPTPASVEQPLTKRVADVEVSKETETPSAFEKFRGTGMQILRHASNLPVQAWQASMPFIELGKLAKGVVTGFLMVSALGGGVYLLRDTPYTTYTTLFSNVLVATQGGGERIASVLASGMENATHRITTVGKGSMEIATHPNHFFSRTQEVLAQIIDVVGASATYASDSILRQYHQIHTRISDTKQLTAALLDIPGGVARNLYDTITSLFDGNDATPTTQDKKGTPVTITEKDIEEARRKLLGEESGSTRANPAIAEPTTNTPLRQVQSEITRLQNEVNQLKRSGITIESPVAPKLVERIVERVIPGVTQTNLDDQLNILRGDIASLRNSTTQQTNTIYRTVALSQKIDQLNDVTLTSITVSGVSGLTNADIPDDITVSNYLLLTGGTISGNLQTTGTLTAFEAATIPSFSATSTTNASTINYRLGIGTSSPYAALAVVGETVSTYFTATSTTATSTFSGQAVFNNTPGAPHTFASWATGVAGAQPLVAPLVVNPASAGSDTNLISASVNGAVRFLIDAEGDIYANGIFSTGGTTLSTTTASTFSVENSATLGDATTTDSTYFNSRIGSSLIPTVNNLLDIGDTTNGLAWRTGIFATSLGIGTTSPWGVLSVDAPSTANNITPIFVVADKGTSTPFIYVSGIQGDVGIRTNTPTYALDVAGSIRATSVIDASYFSATSTTATSTIAGFLDITGTNSTSTISGGLDVLGALRLGSSLSLTSTTATTTLAGGLALETTGFVYDFSSNNVGIGTAAPGAQLHLNTASGQNAFRIGSTTDQFIVNNVGNVGVGTTSPGSLFSVDGGGALITNTSSSHSFYVEDVADDTTPFVIASNGQVGVGTTTMTSNMELVIHGDGQDANIQLGRSSGALFDIRAGQVTEGVLFALTGGTGNMDFYHGSTMNVRFANSGNVFFGDSSNANMTQGLTINQAGADNQALAFKSSDVSHGITSLVELDTYGALDKASGDDGGIEITGYSEDTAAYAIYLTGYAGTANTAKSTSAVAPTVVYSGKRSGTSVASVGTDGNLLVIQDVGSTEWLVDAEGDTWQSGGAGFATSTAWGLVSIENTGSGPSFVVSDQANDTSSFVINTDGKVGIGTNNPSYPLHASSSATVAAQFNVTDGTTPQTGTILLTTTEARTAGQGVSISFNTPTTAPSFEDSSAIGGLAEDSVTGNRGGYLSFWTRPSGDTLQERLRITSAGDVCDVGGVDADFTDCASDSAFKEDIVGYEYGLEELLELRPVEFSWNALAQSKGYKGGVRVNGFIAQEVETVLPSWISTNIEDGGYKKIDGAGDLPLLLTKSVQEIAARISLTSAPTTTPSLYIDSEGRLGVGTTTPAYTLHVIGDVAAESFVNISTKEAKKDISYLGHLQKESLYEKLKDLGVATYYYEHEDASDDPERLGLIAEEAPEEVLAKGGKGVDLYKLVTALLAAFQTLAEKVEKLEDAAVTGVAAVTNSFSELFASKLTITNLLCLGDTCIGESELQSLLTNAGLIATSTTPVVETPDDEEAPDTEAPTITITGANPAEIELNAAYSDNGATVADNVNGNLGYTTYVNGILMTPVQLDTATTTTHLIDYVATDSAGNTATSTRTVNIVAPQN